MNLLLLWLLQDLMTALIYIYISAFEDPIIIIIIIIINTQSVQSIQVHNFFLYNYNKITHQAQRFSGCTLYVSLTITRMRNISIENAQKSNYACRLMMLVFCLWSSYGMICTRSKVIILCDQLPEKTLGRGWVVLVVNTKWWNISLISQGRNRWTIGSKHSKNSKRTTQWTTSAIWKIFAVLSNPLSPKLADKQAIEDELNIDGGKHVLACF